MALWQMWALFSGVLNNFVSLRDNALYCYWYSLHISSWVPINLARLSLWSLGLGHSLLKLACEDLEGPWGGRVIWFFGWGDSHDLGSLKVLGEGDLRRCIRGFRKEEHLAPLGPFLEGLKMEAICKRSGTEVKGGRWTELCAFSHRSGEKVY